MIDVIQLRRLEPFEGILGQHKLSKVSTEGGTGAGSVKEEQGLSTCTHVSQG